MRHPPASRKSTVTCYVQLRRVLLLVREFALCPSPVFAKGLVSAFALVLMMGTRGKALVDQVVIHLKGPALAFRVVARLSVVIYALVPYGHTICWFL